VELITVEQADAPGSFRLVGELDISNVDEVGRQLHESLRQNNGLTLDIQRLTFMDSQGLRMLIQLGKQAVEQFTTVRVLNCSGQIRQLLDLTVSGGIPGVEITFPGKP
jgi:anti-anti-sigma factor